MMDRSRTGALYFSPTADHARAAFLPSGGYVPQTLRLDMSQSVDVDSHIVAIAKSAGPLLHRANAIFLHQPDGLEDGAALRFVKFAAALSIVAKAIGAVMCVVTDAELVAVHETDWQATAPNNPDISKGPIDDLDVLNLAPITAATLTAVHQAAQRIGVDFGTVTTEAKRRRRNRHANVSRLLGAALLRTASAA